MKNEKVNLTSCKHVKQIANENNRKRRSVNSVSKTIEYATPVMRGVELGAKLTIIKIIKTNMNYKSSL